MLQLFKKIIKSRHIKIISICLLALVFVTAVWALVNVDLEDGFRVDAGVTVTVDIPDPATAYY